MSNYGSRASQVRQLRSLWEEESGIPGFSRFSSADPRFPVSIACPKDKPPFYDYNRAHLLHVDFSDSGVITFSVRREDLAAAANNGEADAAAVAAGRKDPFWLMQQDYERKKRQRDLFGNRDYLHDIGRYQITKRRSDFVAVGTDGFRAPVATTFSRSGSLGGECVFFSGRDPAVLWTITWNPNGGYDQATFRTVLSSFRWLDAEWFRSIGMFA